MFLIMNPLTFSLLCSSVFSFWFTVPFTFSSRPVYVASHVRTRLAHPWHVLYTLLHVLHTYATSCSISVNTFLVASSLCLTFFLSLEFLKIFSNFSTVVCCTFLTRLTHVRHVVTRPTHVLHTSATFLHVLTRLTHVRHVYNHICGYFPRLFLTLSLFLPLTWFLVKLFQCCSILLHVHHVNHSLLHFLHEK